MGDGRRGANPGPPPTLQGGVELADVAPEALLVGTDLAFGTPLPSEEAAGQAFATDPEVSDVLVRTAYSATNGRRLAQVLVLSLVGAELFDEEVLAGFEAGVVAALAGADPAPREVAGRTLLAAEGEHGTVVAFREGDALAVVRSTVADDALAVTTRQIEARLRGEVGTAEPRTPLVALRADAVFVPVPTIAFTPFSAPEDEPPPEPPALPGAIAFEGRYGVVAGERRTVVWGIAVDLGAYPTAEALQPAMTELAAARAGGSAPEQVELVDRVVLRALAPVGERSAHVFRHQGVVVLVEGEDPAQLDAVTTAWITALAG